MCPDDFVRGPDLTSGLFSARVVQIVIFAPEEFLGKFCDDVRVVVLARENVQIHRVRRIRKVCRDEGCFDELRHRITRHPFVFAKVDDDALTETLHFDEVAQFDHELLNLIRVADNCRIASVDVNSGM